MKKWVEHKSNEEYALVTWHFRQEPRQVIVWASGVNLEDVLKAVPEEVDGDITPEATIVMVTKWITNGDEILPHPNHIHSLFTVRHEGDEPEQESEEKAA